jgi:formylglycine-generating enzyme required for sulfatase activity
MNRERCAAALVSVLLCAAAPNPSREDAPADVLLVPAGPFTMGADRGGEEDEHPAHEVTLPAFWLDKTEVTNEAYERCVEAKVCRPHDPQSSLTNHLGGDEAFRRPEQPISCISWDDATAYCHWVGKRLPREAEWEKAARGTDARRYPWGNEQPDQDRAVFATSRTADVGSHPKGAGPYGHLDMAGNVWEWMDDIYDPYAYRRPSAAQGIPGTCDQVMAAQDELRRQGKQGFTGKNPIPTECEHVLRGGAFNYDGPGLRSSNRVHHPGRFRLIMSGFRCAKDG